MKKFQKKQEVFNSRQVWGFTLVETMVAMAIGVVLFGITISYNRSSNVQLSLYTEQSRIVGFLNRAKSFALEKRAGAANVCAFGIHYEEAIAAGQSRLILFRDLADVGDICPAGGNRQFDGPNEQQAELLIDSNISVLAFPGDIVFEPPYLQTDYQANYNELGLIKIEIPDGPSSCVAVGPGGTIYSLECPEDFVPPAPPGDNI
ncbi:MAG: prepilin-type N-terminal cleavage/methylation domain-containing protein [bacterium]|nr:prepilin-type N-terminal cleavage/methylation domain-containing protein [bacterium]